jgi:hypothetical protein
MRRAIILVICMATPAISSTEIYKCRVGERTVYQEAPCAVPGQSRTVGGNVTVVQPFPHRTAPPSAISRTEHPQREVTAAQPAGEHEACQPLRDSIRRIDTAARQRSTPRLAEQRREAKQKLSAYGCSEMAPR